MNHADVAMALILDKLLEAEKKFPGFPEDVVHCSGILMEEAGEVAKAANQLRWGQETDPKYLIKEIAHTGAMSLRFLIRMLDEHHYPPQDVEKKGGETE